MQSPGPWTQEYSPLGPGMQSPGPWNAVPWALDTGIETVEGIKGFMN